jgi:putative nucleotidyltransferase with HDIG domain
VLPFWNPENDVRAKKLIYRLLEEISVTKAALYLVGTEGDFELATSYGFGRRDILSAEIKLGHPLWDWIRRHRTAPAFQNDLAELDPELRSLLENAGTSRIFTVPLAISDRLVGLIDARDKARRLTFGPEDVPTARSVAGEIELFLREIGAYGPAIRRPSAAVAVASGVPAQKEPGAAHLHRGEVEDLTALLRSLATMPGVAAIALTITDGRTSRVLALRTVPLDQRQQDAIVAHQTGALADQGLQVAGGASWGWVEEDSGGGERRGDEIRTAVLHAGPPLWILLSVISPAGSPAGPALLTSARRHLDLARSARDNQRAARNLARTLLEPGETSYPHLRQHAQSTSEIAQRIAATLRLGDAEEELITVAAYLHDVGMRELDYSRVYRMDRPGEAERRLYQRHPVVGARIVETSEFPGDLPGAIRHHHERWDGAGYPGRLAGAAIPRASRIIHIAEVYDTLTSPSSYRRSMGRDAALDVIRAESGKQFEPDLVPVLQEVVRS